MIGGARPFEREFCIKWTTGAAAVLISAFTKSDEYSICIAIITMEYEITNNVH